MVYLVIFGVLLSIFILKYKDQVIYDSSDKKRSRRSLQGSQSIMKDICNDLIELFHLRKPDKFIGPLEPLNDMKVLKNLVMVEHDESFTINKKVIHLCTKDPQTGKYYNKNTLLYVVLHELAHVLCCDIGHTDKFVIINSALLEHAIKHGFYDPTQPFVKNYCSLK
jgi:hypothetical protein